MNKCSRSECHDYNACDLRGETVNRKISLPSVYFSWFFLQTTRVLFVPVIVPSVSLQDHLVIWFPTETTTVWTGKKRGVVSWSDTRKPFKKSWFSDCLGIDSFSSGSFRERTGERISCSLVKCPHTVNVLGAAIKSCNVNIASFVVKVSNSNAEVSC